MRTLSVIKLLTLFAVAFSLATLAGTSSANFHLPTIAPAHAVSEPCQTHGNDPTGPCAQYWYPGGPAMSTELVTIFTNEAAEYTNLLSGSSSIDLTDWPVPAAIPIGTGSQLAGPGYYLTDQIPAIGYFEIQFHLDNVYWGCQMQFGNSACGTNIRQAVAHMIDKTIFATKDPNIRTTFGIAIDNPLPTTIGGSLLSADSCLWDSMFPQPNVNGTLCSVGAGSTGGSIGGGAYHLASATGIASISCPWCQAPGSADLNAAAAHLVAAGLAQGCDNGIGAASCTGSTDSRLSGITATLCTSGTLGCPNFFIRDDNPPRLDLGNSLAAQICYMFTGLYTTPCAYLNTTPGPITAFPGFQTCTTTVCQNWWMYTAAYGGGAFYDSSLYFTYNSAFVSGVPSIVPPTVGATCSSKSVPTAAASNYMYLCNPGFDTLSNGLETSPCLKAPGDPIVGANSNLPNGPTGGQCTGGTLSSHSFGVQAEEAYGKGAFTLPVFEEKNVFGYLQCTTPVTGCVTSGSGNNVWQRADNNVGVGLFNFFSWFNAWNQNPAVANTVRQGFKEATRSVNPFIASTVWDAAIEGSTYDSLLVQNPLATSQFFNWMTQSNANLTSTSYTPPTGTAVTYRFLLRGDLNWQDGRPVTSWDIAFSYLSMVGSGAFLGTGASIMTGVTVLSSRIFDISVSSTGPFVLPSLTGIPIVPGRFWTNAGGSSWDSALSTCGTSCGLAQYTLSGPNVNACVAISGTACTNFPNTLMTINPADTAASFDPILTHIFVGSGAYTCGTVTTSGSGTCTPDGKGNGEKNSYTLSANNNYFRSSLNLAKYLWSGESDTNAIGPAAAVGACFQISPASLTGTCGHWQQGAGNPNSLASGTVVSITTVQIVDIFFNLNWVFPFEWGSATNSPVGIAPLPPLLYGTTLFDGSLTYTPNPGGSSCTTLNSFYDC